MRGLVTVAASPALSAPNGNRLAAATNELVFMISVDIYLNETTSRADLVLPAHVDAERANYDLAKDDVIRITEHQASDAVVIKGTSGSRVVRIALISEFLGTLQRAKYRRSRSRVRSVITMCDHHV